MTSPPAKPPEAWPPVLSLLSQKNEGILTQVHFKGIFNISKPTLRSKVITSGF
jgi:hypothetical protein